MEQARIVTGNVVKVLQGQESESFEVRFPFPLPRPQGDLLTSPSPLRTAQTYTPTPAAIHLTLGFRESVIFRNPPQSASGEWDGEPVVLWKDDGREDMGIRGVWERRLPGFAKREEDYHL